MSQGYDDELEYFDDEEYFDPDDMSGGGRGGSHVLGGSGSRGNPPERQPRGTRSSGGKAAGRRAVSGRSPAPAAASSEERRARLAGKTLPSSSAGRAARPARTEAADSAAEQSGRLGGLRARFSRGEAEANPEAQGRQPGTRLSRIGGTVSRWRGRISSGDGSEREHQSGGRGRAEAAASARPSRAPRIKRERWLDLDRKLDIIGVVLVFGAIVFSFSALSQEQAAISAVHALTGQLLGWGAFAVPIAMFTGGMWLIIRHFGERAPVIDPIRLTGGALVFLSVLALFQFVESLGYGAGLASFEQCAVPSSPACVQALVQQSYLSGRGGGMLGGWVYSALVNNVTELGAFVLVFMLMTIGAMMATRSSIVELGALVISLGRGLRDTVAQRAAKRRAQKLAAATALADAPPALRVSKPRPAALTGASHTQGALPPPTSPALPLPARLRSFFSFPSRLKPQREHQPAPLEREEAPTKAPGRAARFFQRGRQGEGHAGAGPLERFLNMGDNLPPPAAAAASPPPAQKPPAAMPPARREAMPPPKAESEIPRDEAAAAEPEKAEERASIAAEPPATAAASEPAAEPARPREHWELPDYFDMLDSGSASQLDEEPLRQLAATIEDTLTAFHVPGTVVEINPGPVITQYGVKPGYIKRNDKRNRIKVSAIANLQKDLQLALGAESLRIEAPVPGKGYVGIEVPNPHPALVRLRDVMESGAYQNIESPLAIALGMSVAGAPIAADIADMPHLLIAGTTGSGKSKCINAIIVSLLATCSPAQVKFIMIDPKRVELTGYNGLPHLVAPVVDEPERAVGALHWVTGEMDRRYRRLSAARARNIVEYNANLDPDLAPLPYIVVIIDELADLMMMAPDDTEQAIQRLTAVARATGIHLIIATQRPSVDVVTGIIKANCPARIAFKVASGTDSKVILDQTGAENLLGKGDMLYDSGKAAAPLRMQGVFVGEDEIERVSRYWKLQGAGLRGIDPIPLPATKNSASGKPGKTKAAAETQAAFWDMAPPQFHKDAAGAADTDEDPLYQDAVTLVRRRGKASISNIQTRLRIGYGRAARIMDMLEERGVVGPPKHGSSLPRDVLPWKEEE